MLWRLLEGVARLPAGGAFVHVPGLEFFTLDIPRRVLLLALFWLAAWALGEPAARRLKAEPRWLYGLVLGSGALSLIGLALGLAGLFHPPLLRGLLAALAAVGAWRRGFRPSLPRAPGGWAAVGVFAAGTFLLAQAPVTFYDALVYHLSLPDLYLRRGAIEPVPTVAFSGLPAGQQMLYAWLLTVGDGPLCQLLAWSQALLTVLLLAAHGGRAGVWAGALWLSSPMVVLQASRPGTEAAGALYLVAAVLAGGPVTGGLCAGLALGSKYQGGVAWLAGAAPYAWRRDWRSLGLFTAAAGALFVPWLARNAWLYGAPLFPLTGGHGVDAEALKASGEPQGAAGLWRWAGQLWRASFVSETSSREAAVSAGYVLALPLLRRHRLLWAGAAAFLPMAMATGILRYQIPALAVLALPAAEALLRLPLVLPPLLALTFLRSFASFDGGAAWGPKDWFLSESRPGYPAPPYKAFQWMNANLPPDAKVLLVCEDKSFYLERDRVPASSYARQPVELDGVTHVFVNEHDVNGFRTQRRLPLDRLEEVWRDGLLVVFAVARS